MRGYIPEADDYAYDQPRHTAGKGVLLQRTKTVVAGDHLDADIYPVLDWQYSREAGKRGKTPEQMRKANFRRAFRYFVQLCNANFDDHDLKCELTMARECSFDEFKKIKRNFFDRLRKKYRAAGVKLEYAGIIESTHQGRQHHIHMVLRGGVMSRDEVERLWGQGTANVDRVQTAYEDKGLEGFVRYMTQHKDTQEKLMNHKWFASKGLKKPRPTYNDSKFSRRASMKLAQAAQEDAKKLFEKKYPGWRLVEYSLHYSDFLPGVYIHAHMRRKK